jgi:hypothetical protein
LQRTQGQKKFSESDFADWLVNEITVLGEAFGEGLTAERQAIYGEALADIDADRLRTAFRRARYELRWFPKIAELRELAGALPDGASDGRPGPEEAWARMPKGERIEDDTVVWCEEERAAYDACRSLLLDGDQIAARMAFKERYERALAEARSQGRPARWTVSAGYDVGHRLTVLAAAVGTNQIDLEAALQFVPDLRRDEFAQMLPAGQSKGLLGGKGQISPEITGFLGVLAKLRMEDCLPEELQPDAPNPGMTKSDLSDDDIRRRREELAAQVELINRSRNGSGRGVA